MSSNAPANPTTDRTVSIVMIVVGVVLTLVWAPISIMAVFMSDNGMNFAKTLALYTMWFGPFLAVLILGIITIVKMARKERSLLFGVLTGIAPIAMVIIGFLLMALGFSMPTSA